MEWTRRIREVQSSVNDEMKYVMIASSDGRLVGDVQPLARFGISCIADDDGNLQVGRAGGGGRVGIDFFENEMTPEHFAREAARQAIIQLEAIATPAGTMEVVLGPGWPGILLHEAVGSRSGIGLQPQTNIGFFRAHRSARCFRAMHGGRRRHDSRSPRFAQHRR